MEKSNLKQFEEEYEELEEDIKDLLIGLECLNTFSGGSYYSITFQVKDPVSGKNHKYSSIKPNINRFKKMLC